MILIVACLFIIVLIVFSCY